MKSGPRCAPTYRLFCLVTALSLSYNQSGQLSTVTEATGRSLTFGYDGQHISSITDPLNRTISFGYTNGNLTSVTDRRGKT